MSEPIQSISNGNYILQGTVATSAGIVGDGTTQNPIRVDETVLYSSAPHSYGGNTSGETIQLSESITNFERLRFYVNVTIQGTRYHETREIDNFSGSAAGFQYGPYPENNITANWFILRAGITNNICNVSATHNAYTSVQAPYWGNKWFPGSLYKIVGINRKAQ